MEHTHRAIRRQNNPVMWLMLLVFLASSFGHQKQSPAAAAAQSEVTNE